MDFGHYDSKGLCKGVLWDGFKMMCENWWSGSVKIFVRSWMDVDV